MNNYQVQQAMNSMVQMMTVVMSMGMIRAPIVMLQTMNKDIEKEVKLTNEYGKWAVGFAAARCPKGDWKCIEREASRQAAVMRERYG